MKRTIIGLSLLAIGCREEAAPIAPLPAPLPAAPAIAEPDPAEQARAERDLAEERLRVARKAAEAAASDFLRPGVGFSIRDARPSRRDPETVAVLIETGPSGSDDNPPYACIVGEGGVASKLLPEERFWWEVEEPRALAERWARQYQQGRGSFRTESVQWSNRPPLLDALVVEQGTGRRYRLKLLSFTPAGYANFEMTPVD